MRHPLIFVTLIILGILVIFTGLVYGMTSRQITYQKVGRGTIAHYLSADGTGYLQMSTSPTLYVVNETNFMPRIQRNRHSKKWR